VCTELATLGLGEHWLIDLVVAIPFTFAIQAMVTNRSRLRRSWPRLLSLVLMLALWLWALARQTTWLGRHPLTFDLAMLATVGASIVLGRCFTSEADAMAETERATPSMFAWIGVVPSRDASSSATTNEARDTGPD
jgi:hypothetical protein